jgi:multiple sugar transport system permease protein
VLLASLLISTAIPVGLFLAFQRFFLRGAGLRGAVKG